MEVIADPTSLTIYISRPISDTVIAVLHLLSFIKLELQSC